ncbi:MAG: HEAT repeat domain-containing protein, partial [Robiginitalea sp.]
MARHRQKVFSKKRELAPMLSNFLFFRQEEDSEQREDYIRMKIEIRDQLKTPMNRIVLSEVLMDLRQDITGEARTRLLSLYQDLGLHRDALRKLKSVRWEKVSQGILELTEMRVDQAYHILKKHINDKRSVIRKQAQLAIVSLREEGIRYVLDTARHGISEWQQLKLMELLKHKEAFVPPRFRDWLISENEDVVLFALRLIRYYRQSDASRAVITLLQHRSPDIQAAALECIREFRFEEARSPLKRHFKSATTEVKILILEAFREVASDEDLHWLRTSALKDHSFLVRSKAGVVINTVKPDSVLPTKDILPPPEPHNSEWKPEIRHSSTEISNGTGERDLKETSVLKADFADIRLDPDWLLATEQLEFVPLINTGSLPEEDWTPEHEKIFAHCFLEELRDLLSMKPEKVSLPELSFDFIPVVTEESIKITDMEPHQPTPDWLLRLEVQAEILSADSGYAKILREILLEDLAETEQVFTTNFVPWVTGKKDEKQAASETISEDTEMDPDFGVIAGDIQQIDHTNDGEPPATETGEEAAIPEGEMNYFSIFREFFRSYDRESKLILLDEIPEIGTEKELQFLQELFEDPDEKVAAKGRQVYALLAKRLGIEPEALKNKGSQTLWTPSSATLKNTSIKKDPARSDPNGREDPG